MHGIKSLPKYSDSNAVESQALIPLQTTAEIKQGLHESRQIESLNQQIKLSDKHFLTTIVANSLSDFSQFFNTIEDDDKKILLQSLIKEIHINPADKPKNRTIKDIIYKFDLAYLNQAI